MHGRANRAMPGGVTGEEGPEYLSTEGVSVDWGGGKADSAGYMT